MNFYQLDGYLRAICCGPGVAQAEEWLPLVFNDGLPDYSEIFEADRVGAAIMNLYHFHAGQVTNDLCDLPCSSSYRPERDERMNLEQWARGFMQGYIFWESSWNEILASTSDQNYVGHHQSADVLDRVLDVIATVADVDFALVRGVRSEALESIFASLPETIIQCGMAGKMLYRQYLEKISCPNPL